MSSAVTGYKATLGADAPPACYNDLNHAELIVIAGSNAAWAHPILYRRVEDAKAKNLALKLVCIEPRRTETARAADRHLPILPGTDVALFNTVLHWLMWEDATDASYITAHTEGFAELKTAVRECTPAWAARICGVNESQIVQFATWWKQSNATLSIHCQGPNQSSCGTDKNAALIKLHLATAQRGKLGTGPFSLTGLPNAMGGREVSGLANLLPGHRDVVNPEHRAEIAKFCGVDSLPPVPGKTAMEMFDAVKRGEIKLLWIACTNPAQSLPDLRAVAEAFENAECVIVQESFRATESAKLAHVLLPASTWGEKHRTVTNSERRITHVSGVVSPPGSAHDGDIVIDFARRLEAKLWPNQPTLFPYETPEDVFNEHREATRGRDLDITGMSYDPSGEQGPQQWLLLAGETVGKTLLYEDGIYPNSTGEAKLKVTPYKGVVEPVDALYPLALTTGRLRDQSHCMSRTPGVCRSFTGMSPIRCSP